MPRKEEILRLLDLLDYKIADELETEELEFKPWNGNAKDNLPCIIEYVVCLTNARGGTIVFGVADGIKGRAEAIRGCKQYDIDKLTNQIYDATTPSIRVQIEELHVHEGTLLLIHVATGIKDTVYGTIQGLYKIRIGTSCRGLSPSEFVRSRMSIGVIDWSAERVEGLTISDLDPLEIERYRNTLRAQAPESDLLRLSNEDLLKAIRALEDGKICNACVLMFGRSDVIQSKLPQQEVLFVGYKSQLEVYRESNKQTILVILERLTELLLSPSYNPIQSFQVDLFRIDVPKYPKEVLREALLNAIIHRDFTEQGQVYVQLEKDELTISNPGGFIGGITPKNILTHEPRQRNKRLTEIIEKSRLVERAGVGRRRIFIPMLSFGKRMPVYHADEHTVSLTLYGGGFNERIARFVSKKQNIGMAFEIADLIVLNYLIIRDSIDLRDAAILCQRDENDMRLILEELTEPKKKILEKRGKRSNTYHLDRSIAVELLGKVRYSQMKDIETVRFPEMIKQYVELHDSINNKECRELLKLGDSLSASVTASQILNRLSGENGFLKPVGESKAKRRYVLRQN